jgi:hypothetical protein
MKPTRDLPVALALGIRDRLAVYEIDAAAAAPATSSPLL